MDDGRSISFSFVFPEEINEPFIKYKFSSIVSELFSFSKDVDRKMQILKEKTEFWRENIQSDITDQYNLRENIINLDVRGRLFISPKAALVNRFGSYLHALVCSPNSSPASHGKLSRSMSITSR